MTWKGEREQELIDNQHKKLSHTKDRDNCHLRNLFLGLPVFSSTTATPLSCWFRWFVTRPTSWSEFLPFVPFFVFPDAFCYKYTDRHGLQKQMYMSIWIGAYKVSKHFLYYSFLYWLYLTPWALLSFFLMWSCVEFLNSLTLRKCIHSMFVCEK